MFIYEIYFKDPLQQVFCEEWGNKKLNVYKVWFSRIFERGVVDVKDDEFRIGSSQALSSNVFAQMM